MNRSRILVPPVDWHPPDLAQGTRLWKLNLHYMEYLVGFDDESFRIWVEDWIRQNPPYQHEYWLDTWNSYALSIRTVNWLQELERRRADAVPVEVRDMILRSVWQQLQFLERNLELDVEANHLVKNVRALIWGAASLEVPEASNWRATGHRFLDEILEDQILADGMHYERSVMYHAQVFGDLLDIASVLENELLRAELRETLRPMAQVLTDLTHPDGCIALFNDSTLHEARSPASLLDAWRELSGDEVPPAHGAFSYPDAGYFGWRGNRCYVAVDCGRVSAGHVPAHAHGDILSFVLSVKGRRLVVDPGVYEYSKGPQRRYARATTSHNTVSVAGEDQCEFFGAFRMGRRAEVRLLEHEADQDGFRLVGEHTGFAHLSGEPVHRRKMTMNSNGIRVVDEVTGGDGQRVTAGLLLHPDCRLEKDDGALIIRRDHAEARLATGRPVTVEKALWFPDFGVRRESQRICLDYGQAPCEADFIITFGE